MRYQVIPERWKKLQIISLSEGAHSADSQFCVMEAVAFVAGEDWSDHPRCACPVISAFLRSWNDALPTDADRDRLLKPLVPLLVGTRNKKLEENRSVMAADWLIRIHTPAWLRLAGLTAQADSLASLPEITSLEEFLSIRGRIEAVRKDAAWVAATAAAGAWDAAGPWAARAAAGAAAWVAAGAGAAAWVAAGDEAAAGAWEAAKAAAAAAAAARAKLAPTVRELQQSALRLVHRMIEAK